MKLVLIAINISIVIGCGIAYAMIPAKPDPRIQECVKKNDWLQGKDIKLTSALIEVCKKEVK